MRILRHRLQPDAGRAVPFHSSPNVGARMEPRYLVVHYTAGRSADESVRWLCNPAAGASAHVVIGRDGEVTQLVPFDRVAWHAGPSRWDGLQGLNRHSIGIELDNAGRLERKGGRWCAWFGTAYPDDQVMEAVHKHDTAPAGWHLYPPEQIQSALEVAEGIVAKYDIRDVVGHEDISPGRKSDPGPAFPMASFRAHLLGRAADEAPLHETTAALNIRQGPGTEHQALAVSPLPVGTALEVIRSAGRWRLAKVAGEVKGEVDVQGWVHGDFLRSLD